MIDLVSTSTFPQLVTMAVLFAFCAGFLVIDLSEVLNHNYSVQSAYLSLAFLLSVSQAFQFLETLAESMCSRLLRL